MSTPMTTSPTARRSRWFSIAGAYALVLGAALLIFETRLGLMQARLGSTGHSLVIGIGSLLCLWGVWELIAGMFGKFTRHRFYFPGEGRVCVVILIVLFVGALLGRSNTLLLVFSLLAGPFVINGSIAYVLLKKLSIERCVPRRTMAGEVTAVELVLKNRKRILSAWVMTAKDTISNPYESMQVKVLFVRVPPRGQREGHYHMRLVHRGRYTFGPVQVDTRYPLGLAERGITLGVTDEILVYPRIGRLRPDWKQLQQTASELSSRRRPSRGLFDDEFHHIRDYRPGDDPRAIHWPTSARRNELAVREYQESRDTHLALLLDLWQPRRPTEEHRELVERAIRFAATICFTHLRANYDARLLFAANGAVPCEVMTTGGRTNVETILDALALVEPVAGESPQSLVNIGQQQQTQFAQTILVTTRFDAQSSEFVHQPTNGDGQLHPQWSPQVIHATDELLNQVFFDDSTGSSRASSTSATSVDATSADAISKRGTG